MRALHPARLHPARLHPARLHPARLPPARPDRLPHLAVARSAVVRLAVVRLALVVLLVGLAAAQRGTTPAVATPAPDLGCSSIQLTYNFMDRTKIRPFVSDKNKQPYAFRANLC